MDKKAVALVTGCSTGIGYETALALAQNNYDTFASMRDTAKAQDLQNAALEQNLDLHIIQLDVDDQNSVLNAINKITSQTNNKLDVLVNNAGYGQFGCVEDVPLSDFKKQFETNFFSVVRLIQQVAPIMRKQKSGTIINLSSIAGRIGLPGSSAYISSKFALEGLTECLRYELGQFNINVTAIEPGVIKTNFFDSMKVPPSKIDPKYNELSTNILSGLKMMVDMATLPSQVAETIIRILQNDPTEILPRYTVGSDAQMFAEAKKAKTDLEFEKYMSKELFPS